MASLLKRPGDRAPGPGERWFAEGLLASFPLSWAVRLPCLPLQESSPRPRRVPVCSGAVPPRAAGSHGGPFWRGGRSEVAGATSDRDRSELVCTRMWKCQCWGLNLRVVLVSVSPALRSECRRFPLAGRDSSASGFHVEPVVPSGDGAFRCASSLARGTGFSVAAQQDVPPAGARDAVDGPLVASAPGRRPLSTPRSPAPTRAARGSFNASSCPVPVGAHASLAHTAPEHRTSGLGRTRSPSRTREHRPEAAPRAAREWA